MEGNKEKIQYILNFFFHKSENLIQSKLLKSRIVLIVPTLQQKIMHNFVSPIPVR